MPNASDPALECLRKLLWTRLASDERLIDFTTFNGTALWWFVDADFYYFVDALLKGCAYSALWRHRVRRAYSRMEFLPQLVEKIATKTVAWLNPNNKAERNGRARILFTAQDWQWRVVRDVETGCMRKSDAFFDSLIAKLDQCEFVGIDLLAAPHPLMLHEHISKWRILVDKMQSWHVPQRAFESYWSREAWITERAASKHFELIWRSLSNDYEFRRKLRENPTHHWLEARLEYYFLVTFPRAARYIEMAERMIHAENPNLVLVLNENGFFERAIIVAAKKLRTPTLAVQHGVIDQKDKGYVHMRGEISPDGRATSPYCPIPDKTAVYGPYYKRFLTGLGTYPASRVVVTGQPRYDRLARADRLYSRVQFLRKHSISPRDHIILWTTQSHGFTTEENIRSLGAVLGSVQRVKSTTLVIKQHPGETRRHTKLINRAISESEASTVLTSPDSDLHEQLYACDLMISSHSTSILEAVALKKPVIVLNLAKETFEHGIDYAREGIAIEVQQEQELLPTIQKLLTHSSRRFSQHRNRFVGKYLFSLDGKATERVADLAWRMIEEQRCFS
jgi:hypothetical protein